MVAFFAVFGEVETDCFRLNRRAQTANHRLHDEGDHDGSPLSIITEDTVYPNGLCFSPDEKILYVNCSRERVIRAYDVKPDGTVGPKRLFYQYTGPERGVPDGMKCDVAGNVWCTAPGGIWVHDPSGKPIVRIKTPGHHPTNIAFGDDDWKTMYVTNIGSVTRFRVNIAGVPSR